MLSSALWIRTCRPWNRAFELANSGDYATVTDIKSRLLAEAYSDAPVEGYQLAKQLRNGKTMVTASQDRTARLWEVTTGKELAVLRHEEYASSAAFSPDGKTVITASDKTAHLWEAATSNEIAVLKGHEDSVVSAVFSPGGKTVVTASADGTARLTAVSHSINPW